MGPLDLITGIPSVLGGLVQTGYNIWADQDNRKRQDKAFQKSMDDAMSYGINPLTASGLARQDSVVNPSANVSNLQTGLQSINDSFHTGIAEQISQESNELQHATLEEQKEMNAFNREQQLESLELQKQQLEAQLENDRTNKDIQNRLASVQERYGILAEKQHAWEREQTRIKNNRDQAKTLQDSINSLYESLISYDDLLTSGEVSDEYTLQSSLDTMLKDPLSSLSASLGTKNNLKTKDLQQITKKVKNVPDKVKDGQKNLAQVVNLLQDGSYSVSDLTTSGNDLIIQLTDGKGHTKRFTLLRGN